MSVADRYAQALCEILEARDPRYSYSISHLGSEPRGNTVTLTPMADSARLRSSSVRPSQESAIATGGIVP